MFKHAGRFSYKVMALVSAGTVALAGCGEGLDAEAPAGELGAVEQGSICGTTTDWADVEPYAASRGGSLGRELLRDQRAVGIIRRRSTGAAQCTGALIAENIFLTAGHCFTSTTDATNYDVVFNHQVDAAGNLRPTTTVPIAQGLERVYGSGIDFAVVRLASHAGATFGSLRPVNTVPATGATLSVVQHPRGLIKKYHEGTMAGRLASGQLSYGNLDTDGGSSGSPVFQYGNVVGVHTNGGCTSTGGANKATSMADVYASSSVVPALVRFRAGGNLTSQGRITLRTATQSCTRSGDFQDMENGCGLRLNVGDVVTVSCTTNGQSNREIDGFEATGATLTFTSSTSTSKTATFTYAGTGVDVRCSFTD